MGNAIAQMSGLADCMPQQTPIEHNHNPNSSVQSQEQPQPQQHQQQGHQQEHQPQQQHEQQQKYLAREREQALKVVIAACKLCRLVQAQLVSEETITKKDNSPVTVGDYAVQALIIHELANLFPEYPFVAEEDSDTLQSQPEVKAKVLQFVQDFAPNITEASLIHAIALGLQPRANAPRWWTLDPIDGTMGFLRRDQYAVALALMEDNEPVLGLLGCPALPQKGGVGTPGCVLVAVKGQGAFTIQLDDPTLTETPIHTSNTEDPEQAVFTESYVSRGFAHELNGALVKQLRVAAQPLRIDSQCKYAMVARGDSDLYVRLSDLLYREMIWDHAAGVAIVREAGGYVSDFDGGPLNFNVGRRLEYNVGLVCANNRQLHGALEGALKAINWREMAQKK